MGKKVHEKIIQQIGGLIESGNLKGGDRLPPERKLAETFKVSRNTVREAIKILSEKGVLHSRTGAGTYVTESGRSVLETAVADILEQKRSRLKEIIELREIIETQIAFLAAERISDKGISALEEVVAKQEKRFASGKSHVELDVLFHRLVAREAGNSVLLSVYEKLHDILFETRKGELQSPERGRQAIIHHKEIVRSLKSRDGEGAARMMKEHILHVKQSIVQI